MPLRIWQSIERKYMICWLNEHTNLVFLLKEVRRGRKFLVPGRNFNSIREGWFINSESPWAHSFSMSSWLYPCKGQDIRLQVFQGTVMHNFCNKSFLCVISDMHIQDASPSEPREFTYCKQHEGFKMCKTFRRSGTDFQLCHSLPRRPWKNHSSSKDLRFPQL